MILVSSNNNNARIIILVFLLLSLIFIATILFMISPPWHVLVFVSIFVVFFYCITLKFYFLDWDVLVGDNKIVFKNVFKSCTFESRNSFVIKHVVFLSFFYSIYYIQIENQRFFFFYKKGPFLALNTKSVTNEIKKIINNNIDN